MAKTSRPKDPPVSYNFMVALAPSTTPSSMLGAVALASLVFDAAFTQISGLGVQLNVNQVRSGGFNNEVYHLPGGVNRGSLTLKRGLASFASPLMQWCLGTASGSKVIVPKTIIVMLQDKNPSYPPVMTWMLYNAIPVKWEIDELDAKKSDIVIESIEIVFSNMDVVGTS
jgi:phage tail-like protein